MIINHVKSMFSFDEFIDGLIYGAVLGGSLCLGAWINYLTDDRSKIQFTDPFVYSHITLEEALKSQGSLAISSIKLGSQSWKINIDTSEYLQFKVQNHDPKEVKDFVKYVTYKHPQIIAIAEKITERCTTPEEKANKILEFVHQYVYDKRSEGKTNYVRFPLETIVEGNGDCEDLAILGAALMKAIKLDVALIYFPKQEGEEAGHMALGVVGDFKGSRLELNGRKYFCAETTGTDWQNKPSTQKIGEIHKSYIGRKAFVYVVE